MIIKLNKLNIKSVIHSSSRIREPFNRSVVGTSGYWGSFWCISCVARFVLAASEVGKCGCGCNCQEEGEVCCVEV